MGTVTLRPYQQEAHDAVLEKWEQGADKLLLVIPTGGGKTIIFATIAADRVRAGSRVLLMAHRGELLEQAADKIKKATGLSCAVEKAEETCFGSWSRVVVGSVQSLQRENRLKKFPPDYFGTIIVDEAHHAISDGYQTVLQHFPDAKVLGVTATPDRGDMRNLGSYFEQIAYEYTLPRAIKEGYLCPIRAMTIPLKIDISQVGISSGDFKVGEIGTALDPYLEGIASEMEKYCKDRKTVVFLPLIKTSQKFRDILIEHGFDAAEVNGTSEDRAEVLKDFENGKYNVLCNSMLLCLDEETEVLTDRGFVGAYDIKFSDKVANWNPDGSVFFKEPQDIVRRYLEPEEHMVSIDSKTINFRVTNTHRMITKTYSGWKKVSAGELSNRAIMPAFGIAEPFDVKPIQENRTHTKHAINNCVYNLITREGYTREAAYKEAERRSERDAALRFKNPSELTEDECMLIGFWIADGSINHLKRSGLEYTLCQSKMYPVICDWVENLLEKLGIDHKKRERKRSAKSKHKDDYFVWSIPRGTGKGSQQRNGLYPYEPYLKKSGTPLFWGLNEKQFDALVTGYWYGDGFHGNAVSGHNGNVTASDTNREFIDLLAAIGSVRGWRCDTFVISQKNEMHNTQYRIHMRKNANITLSEKTEIKHEEYEPGTLVWCVRTDSKNIITRRKGKVTVMGNTEGWDCPSVDCIIVLRPTKVRSLYSQMVGRGSRLSPETGKDHLLLLDFLWMTERHDLCHPASLICEDDEVAQKMTENLAEKPGEAVDIEDAEGEAADDVQAQREEALAKMLAEQKRKKSKLVDPLQFEMSIMDLELQNYIPEFLTEMRPPTDLQKQELEKLQINPDGIEYSGKADMLIRKARERINDHMATPRQIRQLEGRGFEDVGTWSFEQARKLIDRIAANGWRTPRDINPHTYKPPADEPKQKDIWW